LEYIGFVSFFNSTTNPDFKGLDVRVVPLGAKEDCSMRTKNTPFRKIYVFLFLFRFGFRYTSMFDNVCRWYDVRRMSYVGC